MSAAVKAAPGWRTGEAAEVERGQADSTGIVRLPHDTQVVGLILDSEHGKNVGELIRRTKNQQATAWLGAWRKQMDRLPFLVLAGELTVADAGVIGGISATWDGALAMFHHASDRFDELATRGNFTAAWLPMVTPQRHLLFTDEAVRRQKVEGSA